MPHRIIKTARSGREGRKRECPVSYQLKPHSQAFLSREASQATQTLTQSQTQKMTFPTAGDIHIKVWLFNGIFYDTSIWPFLSSIDYVPVQQESSSILTITVNTEIPPRSWLSMVVYCYHKSCLSKGNGRYKVLDTVMGQGTQQYLHMTICTTFQVLFSSYL